MTSPELIQNSASVLALVGRTPWKAGQRKVIGIAGQPGSGKSTLAAKVVEILNSQKSGQAILLPMDGFHMDNATLDRAGLRAAKGAPQTFDVKGFIAKVAELRPRGVAGTFPLFDRNADRTHPDAGTVGPDVAVIVVEGNYLLLRQDPWSEVSGLLDATVMLRTPLDILEERLLDRWKSHGLSPEAALEKTHGNDLRNARYVLENSAPADLLLSHDGRHLPHSPDQQ